MESYSYNTALFRKNEILYSEYYAYILSYKFGYMFKKRLYK